MKVVVQRCKDASVTVDGKIVGKINFGLVLLVAFTHNDTEKEIKYMVDKILNLRIFDDDNKIMNCSLLDVNGEILSISQFTLYGDATKGRRPSYIKALSHDKAKILYSRFNELLKEKINIVESGIFGADMQVSLINDGPVTLILERNDFDE